ncbi:Arylsulfatase [Novipirellula aureliae]|uniref:Arylsulfatase n=1 Tax=Novipirellula aureliae TaxID=2527966 RepID=A0A5C6E4D2_9BACT|nr:sulfatase [Novipirellula aureliae]TWU43782.1 Arylsulfatase [Novipirellula aureliae]
MLKKITPILLCYLCFSPMLSAKSPNVLLLCIDDLRPELKSFGAEYIESPNIDALASSGRAFSRHYVQAPTCGASRYAMLTGRYGRTSASRGNQALVARSKEMAKATPSFPEVFRKAGYTTVSIGKVSHHPGGRYGKDWNDPDSIEMPGAWDRHSMPTGPWRHPEGAMHGLANGQIRSEKQLDVFESFDGPDTAYPDGLTTNAALEELDQLAKTGEPFLLAVGIIRPHLPFGSPATYMQPYLDAELPTIAHKEKPLGLSTWHGSGEFLRYNGWGKDPRQDSEFADEVRKHYASCVTYADACVGRIVDRLKENGLADDTIIVLWGDHGWHLGEHAVWGKHTLFEESLRSPLIVCAPQVKQAGVQSKAIVESIDLFPTLCDLCELPKPSSLDGESLLPMLDDPSVDGKSAISYGGSRDTIRTEKYRLIRHLKGKRVTANELYDHQIDSGETENIAAGNADVVKELSAILDEKLEE